MRTFDEAEARRLCQELPLIEGRLDLAGLHKTAREFNRVMNTLGWETAELVEKKYAVEREGDE